MDGDADKKLSRTIREERQRRGLSQVKLADAAGMTGAVVSWSETGNRPVSQNALRKILTALELDPEEFTETEADEGEAAGDRTPTRAERRRSQRAAGKPEASRTASKPDKREEVKRLERTIEREFRIWSRMSEVREVGKGTWQIPPETKLPQEISEEAARSGSFDQDSQDSRTTEGRPADLMDLMELTEGLLILDIRKSGPGNLRLELTPEAPETPEGPRAPAAWSFESGREKDAIISHRPVRGAAGSSAGPTDLAAGTYRLRAEAERPCKITWKLTWTQPAIGTGWLNLLEEEPRGDRGWAEPGLHEGGPTAPNWTGVDVRAAQETPAHMEVTAYPVDGSEPVIVLDCAVGPEITKLGTGLDPDREYMLVVNTTVRWDLWFVARNENRRQQDPARRG